ncbi:MAG: tRNA pseudouridine(55) synthase TruB [Patescibacteria group bacterium]
MRHGFLLLKKPRGPTSHDTVARLRRSLGEPKIGHLGTLDPMAEGLLVLAVGSRALKVIELFFGLTKEYLGTITLGAVSTTYDSEGVITQVKAKPGQSPPEDASRIQALIDDRFLGKIQQVPPAFSAVHVGGTRAYRKAQRGEHVELQARETTILECKVREYRYPRIVLSVCCDSGTYIRSLAHDLGESLRLGAYLSALTRTRVGDWKIEDAHAPEDAKWSDVLCLKDVLASFPRRELASAEWEEIRCGRFIDGTMSSEEPLIAWYEGLPVALLERVRRESGKLKPRKVL